MYRSSVQAVVLESY